MNKFLTLVFTLFILPYTFAQEAEFNATTLDSVALFEAEYKRFCDSINASFEFTKGQIPLHGEVAQITIPEGYKFLDIEQSQRLLSDIWGNPPAETLGMLFPDDSDPVGDGFTYAVEISYAKDGYIDDSDARDIDYDELLEEMKKDTKAQSDERVELGYSSMEFIGWASTPFYDEDTKKLHWAQELKFDEKEINTLNYNIRVLGRKGYLVLNIIADMPVLPTVKEDVNGILASVEFKEGYRYADFNPDIDEVAAYGIGGLIAGKVLAKAGFFAVLLKFWKFIAIGAVAAFAGLRKKIFGSKES